MNKLFINKYCHIKNKQVFVDGKLVFAEPDADSLRAFAKSLYRHLKPSYNKFFKMYEISKLGFLAAETLLSNEDLSEWQEDISVVLSNSHSTLITDKNHQATSTMMIIFFPALRCLFIPCQTL